MAGHLLLVFLMCSSSVFTVQAFAPPKLTVNPAVITETDSVTLNCQPPSSFSQSKCYFRVTRGGPAKTLSCLQNLSGAELLKMTNKISPAEVKITCFYLYGYSSPDSEISSIIVRTSVPPTLSVNPPEIYETETVTLSCQPPSSVPVSQCFIDTLSGGPGRVVSCLKTLTGTELLKMAQKTSAAQRFNVKLTCFYTQRLNGEDHPSPHSATSSIIIHSQKPRLSLHFSPGEPALFVCSLPGPAPPGTKCNLYFGEASHPVKTANILRGTTTITKSSMCQFTVTIPELLSGLCSGHQSDASCDYTLESGSNSLSPRSDGYSLTNIVKEESCTTPTMSKSTESTGRTTRDPTTVPPAQHTTGQTTRAPTTIPPAQHTKGTSPQSSRLPTSPVSNTGDDVSTLQASVKPPSGERRIWKFVAVAAGCGATVGVMLLVSAILCSKRRAGSENVNRRQSNHSNFQEDPYYSTILCKPPETPFQDSMYSTVQAHG
ncbi:uncharacterized protein si:ch211-11c3.9 [Xyrichtys novacula]|uniref:Uncharacterized protein si:ch211-11c3.9 n=1 Tax=Xyrichtys novacula TaxID=13765 RepID=A0AAV1ETS2_XYRNO|nr:uncharacterized protein si:ch211-11c3.9 [Xyrichtys novacula]